MIGTKDIEEQKTFGCQQMWIIRIVQVRMGTILSIVYGLERAHVGLNLDLHPEPGGRLVDCFDQSKSVDD